MMIWLILAVVFMAGSLGGLISGFFMRPMPPKADSSKSESPKSDRRPNWLWLSWPAEECQTFFPGLLGSVLLGGVAAAVFWCLYGPFTGTTIIGSPADTDVSLTVGQLATCLLIGMGGPGFLSTEAQRRCLQKRLAGC